MLSKEHQIHKQRKGESSKTFLKMGHDNKTSHCSEELWCGDSLTSMLECKGKWKPGQNQFFNGQPAEDLEKLDPVGSTVR